MNKLLTSALVLGLSGVSFAAGRSAAPGLGALRMPLPAEINQIAVPMPPAPQSTRWWSVDFFGSAHKAIMRAALGFVDGREFSDIARARDLLLPGANDETGHILKTDNGGPVKEIWLGNTPFSKGGVLWNYEHLKFIEAYSRLGTLCHLTQDQAVPAHAANISHYTNEGFEGYAGDGNKVRISAARDGGEMEPYAYYQDLQDDTRRHLAGWKNPATGVPYWEPAPDAPRLGQDATYGPPGHYGGGRDTYVFMEQNNGDGGSGNQQVTASPEIRARQLAMAGAATVAVLEAASRRLPPLVQNLAVTVQGRAVSVGFTALDNRSRSVKYSVSLYRDGAPAGDLLPGEAALKEPSVPGLPLSAVVSEKLDLSSLPAGKYTLAVGLKDGDGNVTPAEVNSDEIAQNDTVAQLTLN